VVCQLWLVGVVALVVALLAGPALGREAWRPLPWHLADIQFEFSRAVPFQGLSAELRVSGTPETGQRLYLAAAYGKIGTSAFYFGLQTDLYHHRSRAYVGKGILFSRWGAGDAADIRIAEGGWPEALSDRQSGEGDFVGVRLPYDWGEGRFAFRLLRRPDAAGQGWWADLLMFDQQRARWIDVGGLHFAAGDDRIQAGLVSFLELYGRPPTQGFPAGYTPPSLTVLFGPPEPVGAGPLRRAIARTGPRIARWAETVWTADGAETRLRPFSPANADPAPDPSPEALLIPLYRVAPAPRRRRPLGGLLRENLKKWRGLGGRSGPPVGGSGGESPLTDRMPLCRGASAPRKAP